MFATRMKQESIDKLLPLYKDAGFYAMEVWGGAVPDSVMRYLGEDPWVRLKTISDAMGGVSKLTALSRGRNLFGYVPYPTSVLEGFYKEAIKNGLNIMRIFDALNDLDNVKESIKLINEMGGIADGAVCYTDSILKQRLLQKRKASLQSSSALKRLRNRRKSLQMNISLRKQREWKPTARRSSR